MVLHCPSCVLLHRKLAVCTLLGSAPPPMPRSFACGCASVAANPKAWVHSDRRIKRQQARRSIAAGRCKLIEKCAVHTWGQCSSCRAHLRPRLHLQRREKNAFKEAHELHRLHQCHPACRLLSLAACSFAHPRGKSRSSRK